MERVTRHRKAFYEKENNFKSTNQSMEIEYSSIQPFISKPKAKIGNAEGAQRKDLRQVKTSTKRIPCSQTEFYCAIYSEELQNSRANFETPPKFLRGHQIDAYLRARMMDWMTEVMISYKLGHKAYFASVQLMDRYFEQCKKQLFPADIHKIGTVCMLISSKMQELYPLKLNTVYEKITHKKIPKQQLLAEEQRISLSLGFKLNSWTFYDLAMCKVHLLLKVLNNYRSDRVGSLGKNFLSSQREKQLVKQIESSMSEIEDVASYVGKVLSFDYAYYCSHSTSVHSDSLLKLTFEILNINCQLQPVLTSHPIQVQMCKEQLVRKIKRFDMQYRDLKNLKRFTSESVIDLVASKL